MKQFALLMLVLAGFGYSCLADHRLPMGYGLVKGYEVMPFQQVGNLILLPGSIGKEEGHFILDTGAPTLVLNSTYFGGKQYARSQAAGVAGSQFSVGRQKVGQVSAGSLSWQDIKAEVAPLGNVENAKNIKILGLLGVALFEDYEMVINYYIDQIYLCPVDRSGNKLRTAELLSFRHIGQTAMKVRNSVMLTDAMINGKKVKASIDTGAEACVLDSRLPNRLLKRVDVRNQFVLQGVGGNKVEVLSGLLDQLICGEQTFDNLQVIITNLEQMSQAYGQDIDLMLGYSWLSRYVISFNFRSETIAFWVFEEESHE